MITASTRLFAFALTALVLVHLPAFASAAAAPAVSSTNGAIPPSKPSIDSPELARLGGFAVGVRTITLVDRNVVDVLRFDAHRNVAPRRDRELIVDLWYPASAALADQPETYRASLPSETGEPVHFTVPGIAVRDAKPTPGRFPLVIVSHGYSNATIAMSWLTENLASKGYVVAAIRHNDLPITDTTGIPELLLRRPLDIAFVARSLQASLAAEGRIDSTRTALIGYSMGGYGVLTAAGAALDPKGLACALVPGDSLAPYAQGGALADSVQVGNLRAVIAISPFGGAIAAWGQTGLGGITAPLLLISGDRDHTVNYTSGAHAFFASAVNAQRYLLTFRGAGHNLGMGPAPQQMRQRLWDSDWFEDAVWRKDRLIGVNLHMITAFLDRFVKGDESRAAYLDGLLPDSGAGLWDQPAGTSYDAISSGTNGITVWKGFQRKHAEGLELMHAEAAGRAAP